MTWQTHLKTRAPVDWDLIWRMREKYFADAGHWPEVLDYLLPAE